MTQQPLLFDAAPSAPQSIWQEVPQARFLGWPFAQQLAYCAARDEDEAEHDDEFRDFYLQRAHDYKEMLQCMT